MPTTFGPDPTNAWSRPIILTCPVHGEYEISPKQKTCPTCLTQAALYRQIEMNGVEGVRPVNKECKHTDTLSVLEADGTLFRCKLCGAGSKGPEMRGGPLKWVAPTRDQAYTLGDCLDEAKRTICGERQDVYGSPEDSFAIIAKYWNIYLAELIRQILASENVTLCNTRLVEILRALDVSHMMILFKMARVQGQAPKYDNYVDLCGYAGIAADRLMKE